MRAIPAIVRAGAAVAMLLFSLPALLPAQTTFATITGIVTDPTGAVVPDVAISATNVATGVESRTVSNNEGVYTIPQLREGVYTLRASKIGFRDYVVQEVQLLARDYRRIDIRLAVGPVDTVVEVTGGVTLIETETARISETRSFAQLRDLPLNTRGIWLHLALVPNVLQASAGSTIRFSGSRANQSHWSIDGTTMSDGVTETQIGPLANYVESFQEIRIDSANNTAEFGTIGQVTMVTRSGTNSFHGTAFDYYSTPWFRARNPFASERATGVSHLPGGSAGGPLYLPRLYDGRNRTFFFASYETYRASVTSYYFRPTVPLAPWRQGDFSTLGTVVRDPLTRQPFPGNRIPAARLNPTAAALQNQFYPLPNFGDTSVLRSQNYQETRTLKAYDQYYMAVRMDHRFSDKDSLMGRLTRTVFETNDYLSQLPAIPPAFVTRINNAATVAYTHTFSPTVLNEFRWGLATNNLPIIPRTKGKQMIEELGLQGLAPGLPDIPGIINIGFAGLGLTGISERRAYRDPGFAQYLHHLQEHVSVFRGRHQMKFGANITRVKVEHYGADTALFGNLTFSNRFTGFPYADFLLGIPSTARRSFAPLRQDRLRYQYDFFFTDLFKLTPRLTLNYGLRYEYHPGWTEENGYLSAFDVGSGSIVVKDGSLNRVSPLFPKAYVNVIEASRAGLSGNTLLKADRNNLAPRIALAYRPWGENTVFRSGFGIYFDVVPLEATMSSVPFLVNEQPYTNPADNPDVILPRVFPAAGGAGPSSVSLPAAINPNLALPYSMQYSLTVEHARWNTGFRLSYIGTNTRQGVYAYDFNSPRPDDQLYIHKARPFPQYPGITYFTNGAGHQFHSFTVEAERRMARGLQFQSSWVWARDIGDLEYGQSLENPFDRRRERSVWPDIPTHRFTSNWIYEFPFGKGKPFLTNAGRALDLLVGGWQISGIYSYYSGQFLTPFWTGPDPTGTAYTSSTTRPLVTIRPDHLRNANLPASQRSLSRWFDTGAFAAPPIGRFGNSAKGVIKGPWVNVWHLGLFKSFSLTERVRFRWELTATNAFNHPNYSNPGTNISQVAQAGVITGVGGVQGASTGDMPYERSFRTGLRLEW